MKALQRPIRRWTYVATGGMPIAMRMIVPKRAKDTTQDFEGRHRVVSKTVTLALQKKGVEETYEKRSQPLGVCQSSAGPSLLSRRT